MAAPLKDYAGGDEVNVVDVDDVDEVVEVVVPVVVVAEVDEATFCFFSSTNRQTGATSWRSRCSSGLLLGVGPPR
jgi:hypothetical protein